MVNVTGMKRFGRVDLAVSPLSYGTAPIGNIFTPIPEEEAGAMVARAWEAGLRYFDTAPYYGHGLAELRTGHYLRWRGREDYVLSTKVGRRLRARRRTEIDFQPWCEAAANELMFDYSYDGTMRAFEDSLQRLALEHIDILFIHDIDRFTRGDAQAEVFAQAMDGCWRALESLREQKLVKAIGVGVNEWEVCQTALEQRDFDCFLLAGRYTLLEQESLSTFLPMCEARGAAVVVGGGFNSGILATGAVDGAKYNYAPAPQAIMAKTAAIEAVCQEYNVPLPAAAMQFVTAHPAVASFCVGTRTVTQLNKNLDWFELPIPGEFWQTLKQRQLIREDAPTPG